MNPLLHQLVREHQRELEKMASSGRPRTRKRRAVSRRIGLALIRAGRRLVGPDELQRIPAASRSAVRA
jgi:hypothetical protein